MTTGDEIARPTDEPLTDDEIMDHTEKQAFKRALESHGELHVSLDGRERELEVRCGQFDDEHRETPGTFTLWSRSQPHTFRWDDVQDYYEPHGLWHE